MRVAIAEQFQYRVANYFYMIGMVAEPVIYLVVWSTIARQQGGEVGGFTPGQFAAYYIVWTLVRNMNIIFTPYGWEERIRQGELSGMLLRPIHPIHFDLAYFAGWKFVVIVMWLPIAAVLALLFSAGAQPAPDRRCRLRRRDLGRLPHPIGELLDPRDGDVLDDPGRTDLRAGVHRRAAAVGPARAALAHARVGPAASPTSCRSSGRSASRSRRSSASLPEAELLGGLAMQALWIAIGSIGVLVVWRFAIRRYSAVGN